MTRLCLSAVERRNLYGVSFHVLLLFFGARFPERAFCALLYSTFRWPFRANGMECSISVFRSSLIIELFFRETHSVFAYCISSNNSRAGGGRGDYSLFRTKEEARGGNYSRKYGTPTKTYCSNRADWLAKSRDAHRLVPQLLYILSVAPCTICLCLSFAFPLLTFVHGSQLILPSRMQSCTDIFK